MIKKVDNLVNSNQEMQAGLTELTGQELSEMNGGYAAVLARVTNPGTTFAVANLVLGKRPSDSLTQDQIALGAPSTLVNLGIALANTGGGGIYTGPVTAAKLG